MVGFMNKNALEKTIQTKHTIGAEVDKPCGKRESSGMVHKVDEILIDDEQDSVWPRYQLAELECCHVGYKSCFYRSIESIEKGEVKLNFTESEKVFDPEVVYPGFTNPTKL